MDTARKNSKRKDHPLSFSSFGSSTSSGATTEADASMPSSTHEDEKSAGKSDSGSEDSHDERQEEAQEKDIGALSPEDQAKIQRQREKRLAMNRASARERRKRKRILIEELQEKSSQLAHANLNLRKMNEELLGQVTQLTAILTASQPILAPLLAGNNAIPGMAESAMSFMAPEANALAALQQQERVRALLEASEANRAAATAAAQISSTPHAAGVLPAVPSVQELAQLQQRQLALFTQQVGGMGAANQLLANIIGAGAASTPASLMDSQLVSSSDVASSALAHQALSRQCRSIGSGQRESIGSGHDGNRSPSRSSNPQALQRGHTALDLLRSAAASQQTQDKSLSFNKEAGESNP